VIVIVAVGAPVVVDVLVHGNATVDVIKREAQTVGQTSASFVDHAHGSVPVHVHGHDHGRAHGHDHDHDHDQVLWI
jgi:hypothetical protein